MTDLTSDLNQTITAAVQARVEAAVMEALSGDEVVGQFVTAALTQKVKEDHYQSHRDQPTFLAHTLKKAIQGMTQEAVQAVIEEERPAILREVRKALKGKHEEIAQNLVGGMVDSASSPYRLKVDLTWPKDGD
jgi:hypothetical protein